MSQEYLEEGFDYHSLRIADLRRILTENTIAYPSSAKKKDLLNLYNEFVVPMIPELRDKYNFNDQEDKGDDDDDDDNDDDDVEMVIDGSSSSENNDAKEGSSDSTKKRKLVEIEVTDDPIIKQISSQSRSDSISSISSIEEDTIKRLRKYAKLPSTPQKKKAKLNNSEKEGSKTPILSKLANKKPTESPPKNTTLISHFDISNSSSSSPEDNENQEQGETLGSSSPVKSAKKNKKPSFDFSYKRKNLAPELNTLKVSSEFAEQLKKATSKKEDPVEESAERSQSQDNEVSGFDIEPQSSMVKEGTFNNKEPFSTIPQDYGFNHFEENNSDLPQVNTVSGNELIITPELPTEQDVIDSEQLAQNVVDNINNEEEEEVATQREDTTWLTYPPQKTESVDIIDLSESEDKNDEKRDASNDLVDLDEVVEEDQEEEKETKEDTSKDPENLITEKVVTPTSKTKKSIFKSIFKVILKLLFWCYIAILVVVGLWYYQNKIYIGYCGQQKHFPSFVEKYPDFQFSPQIDSILNAYKPSCVPCPENAICFPYMKLKCKPEYKVEKSSFDVFGLYPFDNKCVKDDKRKELINEVVSKSLDFLRLRNAQLECGESHDDIKSGINEDDLFNIFQESKNKSLNDEEFEDIWEQVVKILSEQPDIIYRQIPNGEYKSSNDSSNYIQSNDIQGEKRYFQQKNGTSKQGSFRSTSKKYITLRCRFEQEIFRTYRKFRVIIWSVVIIAVILKYIQVTLQKYYSKRARVKDLTSKVIDALKKRKQDGGDVKYLSAVQLRDVLMNDEANLKLRNNIWNKVTKNVGNNNTNIKSSLLEVHGDMMRCWEWIGPIEEDKKDDSASK